jgi:hypothetical protein
MQFGIEHSKTVSAMVSYLFQVLLIESPTSGASSSTLFSTATTLLSELPSGFCCHALNPPVPSHSQQGGGLDDGEQFLGGLLDHSQQGGDDDEQLLGRLLVKLLTTDPACQA